MAIDNQGVTRRSTGVDAKPIAYLENKDDTENPVVKSAEFAVLVSEFR